MGSEPNCYCDQDCNELEFSLNGPSPGHAQQYMPKSSHKEYKQQLHVNLRLLGFGRIS